MALRGSQELASDCKRTLSRSSFIGVYVFQDNVEEEREREDLG